MAILAAGTMVLEASSAAEELARSGVEVTVVNCRFLKPYDRKVLARVLGRHRAVVTVEEGALVNGFGAFIAREILDDPELPFPAAFRTLGIPDRFVEHGPRDALLGEMGLDVAGIARTVTDVLGQIEAAGRDRSDRRESA